jgi:hypothetical protein
MVRADRLQGNAARVHALEQADSGAEQHGRQRDRELVDQAGVHVLQDRRAAARDADVAVAGGLAGLVERGPDAVVGEAEGGPTAPLPGVALGVRRERPEDAAGWTSSSCARSWSTSRGASTTRTLSPVGSR